MAADIPEIFHAKVVAVDPAKGIMQVEVPSLMGLALSVRVGHHGPADGVRVNQKSMPSIGTYGIVLCPYGDSRNAVWALSYYTSFIDARSGDTDPYLEYESHWSGAFEWQNHTGDYYRYFPDGTYVGFATSTSLPSITRHTVDSSQAQVSTAFPASQRTTATVAAKPYILHHASGTEVTVSASGSAKTAVASGQTNILTGNGSTVEINATGAISATAATGQVITLTANGTVFQIDTSGNVNVTLAGGAKWNLANGGSASDFVTLSQLLVNVFNNHYHVNSGGSGNGGVPAVPITVSDISSNLIGIQS